MVRFVMRYLWRCLPTPHLSPTFIFILIRNYSCDRACLSVSLVNFGQCFAKCPNPKQRKHWFGKPLYKILWEKDYWLWSSKFGNNIFEGKTADFGIKSFADTTPIDLQFDRAYHKFPKPYQYYQQLDDWKVFILYANWETLPHMYDINLNCENLICG